MDTIFLLEATVDADWVEHSLREEFSELLRAIDLIHEDDDLVDSEFVQ